MKLLAVLLQTALRAYRALVSPVLTALFGPMGMGCRFSPTCSQYAMQAIEIHGPLKGSSLAVRRLCRCHPWGGAGADPVPPLPPALTQIKVESKPAPCVLT